MTPGGVVGSFQIAISDLNVVRGAAPTTPLGLDWLNGNLKNLALYGIGRPSLLEASGMEWYAKNNSFNCFANGGGQCWATNTQINCGDVQYNSYGFDFVISNCVAVSNCNCSNCDTRVWLQSNCNCASNCNCPSNCIANNCNCNCNCNCDCSGRC